MTSIPGTNCAATLIARHVSFDAIVRGLMAEVGLSFDEATRAAQAASRLSLETSGVRHANT